MAVECYICLEGCKSPTCPPCGHVFCETCLEAYVLAQRSGNSVKCPVCKNKFAVDVANRWYLPKKLHKLRESPSLRRLFTSDSDIGSSTAELQVQLEKATAIERDLRQALAQRPPNAQALEAQIEERNRRIAALEEEAKDTKLRLGDRDAKINQLAFCVVILGALLVDLGFVMFNSNLL